MKSGLPTRIQRYALERAKRDEGFHQHLFTVIFLKSSSKNFEHAMFFAKKADLLTEEKMETKSFYIAGFSESPAACLKAQTLLSYVCGWTGTLVMVKGQSRVPWQVLGFLNCASIALRCQNPKAHCYGAAYYGDSKDGIYSGFAEKIIISCKHAVIPPNEFFFAGIPATLEEQLQAKAVEVGCEICPFFKSKVIRSVDEKG